MPSAAFCLMLLALTAEGDADVAVPRAVDPRLKIELFAADPDVVTPCGLAVDAQGRVLVIESHSHFRPTDYTGPAADRIRLLEDRDGDGRAERISTFYEGTQWTMNVGVHPNGSVYVATRSEIFRLEDADGDGTAERRTPIAHLETQGNYPHNGLSGFAFDFDGNVYFGMGENLGAEFTLVGSDGSSITQQEGGQVYRCTADGGEVEMVAFGFWNPFHLAFDAFGRLFAVDNDPDSLPPCRLMHIVPGGNYGYRFRNGRKGVHPFTAWNGELPGTLPMVAGTGEAPSGVVAYESDGLPSDYVGDLLVTSWGDHRLERYRLEPRGASFQAVREDIVTGDENFRPVGIAVAPDGSLFVSDWVLKDYALHGKGRVWHITAVDPRKPHRPTAPAEAIHAVDRPTRERAARQLAAGGAAGQAALEQLAHTDSSARVRSVALWALGSQGVEKPLVEAAGGDSDVDVRTAAVRALDAGQVPAELMAAGQKVEVRAEAMRRSCDPGSVEVLWQAATDADAFLAQAARRGLACIGAIRADSSAAERSAAERLARALVLRESGDPAAERALPELLRDPDPNVRFAAVQWVGEERLSALREPLEEALSAGPATARLFGGYLAALEKLDRDKRSSSDEWAGEQYVVKALESPQSSDAVRRWALRTLRPDHPLLTPERLQEYLASDDDALRLEAVRTLRDSPHAGRVEVLARLAGDSSLSEQLRAEAVVGLSPEEPAVRERLLDLATGDSAVLRGEALRSLRGATLNDDERRRLQALAAKDDATAELVQRVLEPAAVSTPPADVDSWLALLRGTQQQIVGDAQAGGRIFFHAQAAGCSRCHQISGRGKRIGPELTATTGALAERRLIESIIEPSKEVAPQFVAWRIATHSGKTMVGTLIHEKPTGEQTYADSAGNVVELAADEIAERRPADVSVMPEGLAKQLTVQEFRDLVAYLRSIGGD